MKPEENEEIQRLTQWVNDLQSKMYVNCVYCGHRYGPNETTPVTMANVLREHVEQCKFHPMSIYRQRVVELETTAAAAITAHDKAWEERLNGFGGDLYWQIADGALDDLRETLYNSDIPKIT